ncbi:double-CXXCG motif protein [Trinickia sp. LjRoot230]|uniref:imm11 family protein n=1 Tax=Trinickia sp. LjRoot230 TaxID=3342288 RepID=UPI003ECD7F26
MHVYALNQDDSFQALVQADANGEVEYEKSVAIHATSLCGKPFGDDYVPAKLSWGTPRKKKQSDIHTILSPFLVLSGRALSVLSNVIEGAGQQLSVEAPIPGMTGFHVTRSVEDAVDLASSKYKVYPQATVFNRLVLLPNRIKGVDIFRVKEKPATVFVSERFREAVKAHKLTGFDFSQEIPLSV